jgi:hypothetical protein
MCTGAHFSGSIDIQQPLSVAMIEDEAPDMKLIVAHAGDVLPYLRDV